MKYCKCYVHVLNLDFNIINLNIHTPVYKVHLSSSQMHVHLSWCTELIRFIRTKEHEHWILSSNFVWQNLTSESPHVLEEVKQKLEKESLDIDHMESQVKTGSRLVKEKEKKLRQMSTRLHPDNNVSSLSLSSYLSLGSRFFISILWYSQNRYDADYGF